MKTLQDFEFVEYLKVSAEQAAANSERTVSTMGINNG
jgi:hypothetical protein